MAGEGAPGQGASGQEGFAQDAARAASRAPAPDFLQHGVPRFYARERRMRNPLARFDCLRRLRGYGLHFLSQLYSSSQTHSMKVWTSYALDGGLYDLSAHSAAVTEALGGEAEILRHTIFPATGYREFSGLEWEGPAVQQRKATAAQRMGLSQIPNRRFTLWWSPTLNRRDVYVAYEAKLDLTCVMLHGQIPTLRIAYVQLFRGHLWQKAHEALVRRLVERIASSPAPARLGVLSVRRENVHPRKSYTLTKTAADFVLLLRPGCALRPAGGAARGGCLVCASGLGEGLGEGGGEGGGVGDGQDGTPGETLAQGRTPVSPAQKPRRPEQADALYVDVQLFWGDLGCAPIADRARQKFLRFRGSPMAVYPCRHGAVVAVDLLYRAWAVFGCDAAPPGPGAAGGHEAGAARRPGVLEALLAPTLREALPDPRSGDAAAAQLPPLAILQDRARTLLQLSAGPQTQASAAALTPAALPGLVRAPGGLLLVDDTFAYRTRQTTVTVYSADPGRRLTASRSEARDGYILLLNTATGRAVVRIVRATAYSGQRRRANLARWKVGEEVLAYLASLPAGEAPGAILVTRKTSVDSVRSSLSGFGAAPLGGAGPAGCDIPVYGTDLNFFLSELDEMEWFQRLLGERGLDAGEDLGARGGGSKPPAPGTFSVSLYTPGPPSSPGALAPGSSAPPGAPRPGPDPLRLFLRLTHILHAHRISRRDTALILGSGFAEGLCPGLGEAQWAEAEARLRALILADFAAARGVEPGRLSPQEAREALLGREARAPGGREAGREPVGPVELAEMAELTELAEPDAEREGLEAREAAGRALWEDPEARGARGPLDAPSRGKSKEVRTVTSAGIPITVRASAEYGGAGAEYGVSLVALERTHLLAAGTDNAGEAGRAGPSPALDDPALIEDLRAAFPAARGEVLVLGKDFFASLRAAALGAPAAGVLLGTARGGVTEARYAVVPPQALDPDAPSPDLSPYLSYPEFLEERAVSPVGLFLRLPGPGPQRGEAEARRAFGFALRLAGWLRRSARVSKKYPEGGLRAAGVLLLSAGPCDLALRMTPDGLELAELLLGLGDRGAGPREPPLEDVRRSFALLAVRETAAFSTRPLGRPDGRWLEPGGGALRRKYRCGAPARPSPASDEVAGSGRATAFCALLQGLG